MLKFEDYQYARPDMENLKMNLMDFFKISDPQAHLNNKMK